MDTAHAFCLQSQLGSSLTITAMTSAKTSLRSLRIMIVDDHPVFRTGLANLLAAERDLEVVAAVASGDAAVAELGASRAQVCCSTCGCLGKTASRPCRRSTAGGPT